MELWELLRICPGLTAVIGSGGKTSLLRVLARELSARGTVLLTTTTHIMRTDWCPFAATASELQAAFARSPIVCAGSFTPDGKLTAPDFPGWQHAADFVLVEASACQGARPVGTRPAAPAKTYRLRLWCLRPGAVHPDRRPSPGAVRPAGGISSGRGHHPQHSGAGAVKGGRLRRAVYQSVGYAGRPRRAAAPLCGCPPLSGDIWLSGKGHLGSPVISDTTTPTAYAVGVYRRSALN